MQPSSPTNTAAMAAPGQAEIAAAQERFQAFMHVPDQAAMLSFAVGEDEAGLDDLERTAAAHLAATEGDEATAIRQRLDGLRRIRIEDLPAARVVAAAMNAMSADERLLLIFETASESAGLMGLVAGTADEDLDRLEAAAEARIAAVSGEEAADLGRRLYALRAWRAAAQAARRTLAPLGDEGGRALVARLIAWIQTPDWPASQAFLTDHAGELVGEQGAAVLALLRMNNPDNRDIEQHIGLLAACRR
ncbi:MAG: hypothetical protein WAW26_24250, partial [Anaerolineae bacterium]